MKARYRSLSPLVTWKTLPRPPDWNRLFGAERPLEVEIGFGNGEFLIRRARQCPERNLVGIEITWGSVRRALARLAEAECQNVRLVWEDARVAMRWLFPAGSLDRAVGLFPCPWPKKRHAKHRLYRQPFLDLVNSRLKIGGHLLVVTDHACYRDEIVHNAAICGFSCQQTTVAPGYGTKYERKWEGQGQSEFFEIALTKQEHREIPTPVEVEVNKLQVERFSPESFRPRDQRGEITVEFKDFLYDPVRRQAMQEVYAVEQCLGQRFWVQIVCKGDCWWIAPAPGCDVVPVASVQRALELVREGAEPCLP